MPSHEDVPYLLRSIDHLDRSGMLSNSDLSLTPIVLSVARQREVEGRNWQPGSPCFDFAELRSTTLNTNGFTYPDRHLLESGVIR